MSAKFGVHEEDVQHVDGSTGVLMLGVRNDSFASQPSGTNGDYSAIQTTRQGAVRVKPNVFQTITGEQFVVEKTPQLQYKFNTYVDPELWDRTSTLTTSIGNVTSNYLVVSTGAANETGSFSITSRKRFIFNPLQGGLVHADIIFAGTFDSNNYALVGYGTVGIDGVFVGFHNGSFCIKFYRVASTVTANQADWNIDVMDGTGPSGDTLTTTNCNRYLIEVHQYGDIVLYVQIAGSDSPKPVHRIERTGASLNGIFNNCLTIEVGKTANTTNAAFIYIPNIGMSSLGKEFEIGSNTKFLSVAGTTKNSGTETAYLSIRNKSTILASSTNRKLIVVKLLTAGVESAATETSIIRIRSGSNLNGVNFVDDSWTTYNYGSSSLEYIDHSSTPTVDAVVDDNTDRFTAVTDTTVTFPAVAEYPATEDFFVGRILCITGGTAAGQTRRITAYTSGRVATVDLFTVNPSTSDSTFRIENGNVVTALILGQDGNAVMQLPRELTFRLSPGEILTLTGDGVGTPDFRMGIGWVEVE